jgi:ribosomal protein L7/L12
MQALNFDASDLYANRNGQISPRQKARLAKDARGEQGCAAILGLFLLLVAAVGVILVTALLPSALDSERIFLILGFGIIWPLVWGLTGVGFARRVFVKLRPGAQKVEGPSEVIMTTRKDYNSETNTYGTETFHMLRVGGRAFHVKPSLKSIIQKGDVYAVYYAEFHSKEKQPLVLSAERIGGAPAVQSALQNDAEVAAYLKQGDKLNAIKAHRAIYASSFEEAHAAVEELKSRLGL